MDFSVKYHINHVFMNGPRLYEDILLYQIGRAYCEPSASVMPHSQRDFFEWTIVTEGKGVIWTNGEPTAVKAGDIYISFPADIYSIESNPIEPLSFDFITLNTRDEELRGALELRQAEFSSPKVRVIRSDRIARAVSAAIAEMNVEGLDFANRLLHSLFNEVIIISLRKLGGGLERSARGVSEEERLCYQLMNYIDTHIYTMKSLTEVCDITGYNYNYLSNLFKRVSSKTLMEYYTKRRFEVANLLIDEGRCSLTEISELLGFSSLYSFSRAYKNHFGYSPSKHKIGEIEI